jgi:uncharacterized protein (DUF362 family)
MPTATPSPVAAVSARAGYPAEFPYHPGAAYPERAGCPLGPGPNAVYDAVRTAFIELGFDRERVGRPDWNPLGHLVRPGNRVVLKPNLVTHELRKGCGANGDIFSIITHPSVVRAVADYVAIALAGRGEIVVADNPSIDANFQQLLAVTRLHELGPYYRTQFGIGYRVMDLRPQWTPDLTSYGFGTRTAELAGDPEGSSRIDLGERSALRGLNPLLFRGVFSKRWETIRHHHGHVHRYEVANTILNADVFVSLPKLKTHHKVGVTLNLKGLVGINTNKNLLVHWRIGYPAMGGDEYPGRATFGRMARLALRHAVTDLVPEPVYLALRGRAGRLPRPQPRPVPACEKYRGAWSGNDTCWRMVADLYNLFVADQAGFFASRGRRLRFLSVIDGVVGGEGEGPFCPSPVPGGVVVVGEDLLATDAAACSVMGLDPKAVPYLRHLAGAHGLDLEHPRFVGPLPSGRVRFRPPAAWPELVNTSERKALL